MEQRARERMNPANQVKPEDHKPAVQTNELAKQEEFVPENSIADPESELKRMEEKTRAYIEEKKKYVYETAKKKGYSVKEEKKGNNIKLILIKRYYD